MPESYYVSKYSGEEIDALLGSAGAGTVRYDAAQTLNDAQKTQARGNINAAPGGFGYGENKWFKSWDDNDGSKLESYLESLLDGSDKVIRLTNLTDYPSNIVSGNGGWADISLHADGIIFVEWCGPTDVLAGTVIGVQKAYKKRLVGGTWLPWEYANPPMYLGVEYRTTERYLGKPVYVRLMDWGNAPTQGTIKEIALPENSEAQQLIWARLTYYGITFPQYNSDGTLSMFINASPGAGKFQIYSPGEDRSDNGVIQALVKYTKSTD